MDAPQLFLVKPDYLRGELHIVFIQIIRQFRAWDDSHNCPLPHAGGDHECTRPLHTISDSEFGHAGRKSTAGRVGKNIRTFSYRFRTARLLGGW